jgi:hypothetical protein
MEVAAARLGLEFLSSQDLKIRCFVTDGYGLGSGIYTSSHLSVCRKD